MCEKKLILSVQGCEHVVGKGISDVMGVSSISFTWVGYCGQVRGRRVLCNHFCFVFI